MSTEFYVSMMLGPHSRSGLVKVHGFLALAFFQFGRLRIPLLCRIGRVLGFLEVLEIGLQRNTAACIVENEIPGQPQVLAHTHDDDPMASLRDSIVLTLDQCVLDIVAQGCKVGDNCLNGTRNGQQALDVLGNKDLGCDSANNLDKRLVEVASLGVKPTALARMAEVLAGEPPGHDIRCRERVVLGQEFPDISQHVVMCPSIEFSDRLGILENVVLEDGLKREALEMNEAVGLCGLARPLHGNTSTRDDDLLGEADVCARHPREEGQHCPDHCFLGRSFL